MAKAKSKTTKSVKKAEKAPEEAKVKEIPTNDAGWTQNPNEIKASTQNQQKAHFHYKSVEIKDQIFAGEISEQYNDPKREESIVPVQVSANTKFQS